jgi:secreted trypsin-like serine protease
MTANKLTRNPLWATLLAALVAAMVVSFFVFVQSGEAAPQASDKQPSAPVNPQIVRGEWVPYGKYPFMAFLWWTWGKDGYNYCGGSLIDKDSVLTAAHCVLGPPNNAKLQVYVGLDKLSNPGQARSPKVIWYHAGYNPNNQANDAAVINLSSAVSGIKPIELATSSQNKLESPGSRATVAGWGNTFANPQENPEDPPSGPDRMRHAQVPIFTDASAKQFFQQRGFNYVPPLMIAAGGRKNGQDTCQGDSGGPLFTQASGQYTQIGITSGGFGCAAGSPGLYAEVNSPSIRGFITKYAAK